MQFSFPFPYDSLSSPIAFWFSQANILIEFFLLFPSIPSSSELKCCVLSPHLPPLFTWLANHVKQFISCAIKRQTVLMYIYKEFCCSWINKCHATEWRLRRGTSPAGATATMQWTVYVDVEKDVSAAAVRVYLLIVQPSHVARFIYSRDFPSSCMTIPVYQVLKPFSTIQCSRYSYNSPSTLPTSPSTMHHHHLP